jgi:hypothetical protein
LRYRRTSGLPPLLAIILTIASKRTVHQNHKRRLFIILSQAWKIGLGSLFVHPWFIPNTKETAEKQNGPSTPPTTPQILTLQALAG